MDGDGAALLGLLLFLRRWTLLPRLSRLRPFCRGRCGDGDDKRCLARWPSRFSHTRLSRSCSRRRLRCAGAAVSPLVAGSDSRWFLKPRSAGLVSLATATWRAAASQFCCLQDSINPTKVGRRRERFLPGGAMPHLLPFGQSLWALQRHQTTPRTPTSSHKKALNFTFAASLCTINFQKPHTHSKNTCTNFYRPPSARQIAAF